MQKNELKPGQLLAFQAVNSHQVSPVLLVKAEMWQSQTITDGRRYTPRAIGYKLVQAKKGSVAHDGFGHGKTRTGYLVLRYREVNRHQGDTRTPLTLGEQADLLSRQQERFAQLVREAESGTQLENLRYSEDLCWDFVGGRVLAGEWADVYAGHVDATVATQGFNEKGDAWEKQRNADLRETATMLEELLGSPPVVGGACYSPAKDGSGEDGRYVREGYVKLTLEDAQALLALVTARS
jgi:hypothetical protein